MQVQKADNKLKQKASRLVYFIINKVLLKSYYIILLGFDPTKCSYQTTALYLKEFEQMNALPPQLKRRCAMYKDDKDLSEAFIENHALFHKSCVSTYNKQKLSRKRKHAESLGVSDEPQTSFEPDAVEVRINRSNANLQNFVPKCFFCGEGKSEEKLHQCETFSVNQKVTKIAHELQDATILGKLSEGDMIATEAMYHAKCLASYYNNYKRQQSIVPGEDNNGTLAIIKGNLLIHAFLINLTF